MAGFLSVGHFLVSIIFSLILFVLWIRVILRYFRVSPLHPVSQTISRLTNPFLLLIDQRVYPKRARVTPYDWVGITAIILVECVKFLLLAGLMYQVILPLLWLIIFVASSLIVEPCNLLFYALLIRVILSWVGSSPWTQHPAVSIIMLITDPAIRLGQRIIPNISGFDFAPFVMMILLKVITLFITASLPAPLI